MTPSAPTARPDNDEVTLLRAPDDRVSSETPSPQSQPLVQAVHCPEGHPNPVHSDTCRRCAQAITDRAVSTVERPALGRIVFGSGTEVVLNRPVVIGRRPPPQVTVEGQRALPVAVKDSAKLLSRIHVEVRLVDWQVQIVDRDSMNHTFIEIPGSAPMQLRPAEPYPIPPGTTVNLADAARFTYLVSDD